MTACRKTTNPFYVLVVLVGILFCLTACAYGVMTVKYLHASDMSDMSDMSDDSESDKQFLAFLDHHGLAIMLAQILVMAVAAVAAMVTDRYWEQGRAEQSSRTSRRNGC
jgi:hypothetical protein